MKIKEIRDKTPEELKRLLADTREELFKLNVQSMTGQMEKTGRARQIKKSIARVLTVMEERRGTPESLKEGVKPDDSAR